MSIANGYKRLSSVLVLMMYDDDLYNVAKWSCSFIVCAIFFSTYIYFSNTETVSYSQAVCTMKTQFTLATCTTLWCRVAEKYELQGFPLQLCRRTYFVEEGQPDVIQNRWTEEGLKKETWKMIVLLFKLWNWNAFESVWWEPAKKALIRYHSPSFSVASSC
jgi:hypothetical protein